VDREHDVRIFHNLKIFNTKFIIRIQFCMKNIHEKIIIYFSSIRHHIISYISRFKVFIKVQIPLVSGEIKKRNFIRG
jgi:hypothetical protein